VRHFLETLAIHGRFNLHARVLYGRNDHHQAEALFKALGRALDAAPGSTRVARGAVDQRAACMSGQTSSSTTAPATCATSTRRSRQRVVAPGHQDPGELESAGAIILPGVGAFGDAAANLRSAGFEEPLRAAAADGKPLLASAWACSSCSRKAKRWAAPRPGADPGLVVRFAPNMVARTDGR